MHEVNKDHLEPGESLTIFRRSDIIKWTVKLRRQVNVVNNSAWSHSTHSICNLVKPFLAYWKPSKIWVPGCCMVSSLTTCALHLNVYCIGCMLVTDHEWLGSCYPIQFPCNVVWKKQHLSSLPVFYASVWSGWCWHMRKVSLVEQVPLLTVDVKKPRQLLRVQENWAHWIGFPKCEQHCFREIRGNITWILMKDAEQPAIPSLPCSSLALQNMCYLMPLAALSNP